MNEHVAASSGDRELDELVACTLTDIDHKTQRQRWLTLGVNFGSARMTTDDGLRLIFRYHSEVERELRALVEVENGCCPWATWSVETGPDGTAVMVARSRGDGVVTLHTMFTDPCFGRSRRGS